MHPEPIDMSPSRLRARKKRRCTYRRSSVLDALVMSLLEQNNRPLTAHEIARRSHERGSPITATQVYRVLERLTSSNKVERIELLAAYLPSQGEPHGFLVCRCCRSVHGFPVPALRTTVERLCRATGYSPSRSIIEAYGLCAECTKRRKRASNARRSEWME